MESIARLRSIVNNTVISLLGQMVTWTSTLLLTIAYGRFLGDVKFGELYFAISFALLVGFPLEFGFNQQLTREATQQPASASSYVVNTLFIKACLWSILYALLLFSSWQLGYNLEQWQLIATCGFTLLSTAVATTFAAAHYAAGRVISPVVGTILEKGLGALIGFLLLKLGAGVQVMAFVLMGCSIISALWQGCSFFLRGEEGRAALDFTIVRQLLRSSIPFLVYGMLGVIYYRIDTVLLSLMTNTAVVGWYGAGYRLFETLIFLPGLIITPIMYPVFVNLSTTSNTQLRLAIEKSTNFLLFFSLPISTGLIVAAPNIIGFLYYRDEFMHTVPALQALAPGLVFLYINTILTSTLVSIKHENKTIIMAGIALVFNLGLNLFLIPHYLHVGAAAVTSLTELLLLCLGIYYIPKHLLPLGSVRVAIKALVACALMAISIWFLRTFTILVILPIAIVVYFSMAFAMRTIPQEDLRALYQAIRLPKTEKLMTDFDLPTDEPPMLALDKATSSKEDASSPEVMP